MANAQFRRMAVHRQSSAGSLAMAFRVCNCSKLCMPAQPRLPQGGLVGVFGRHSWDLADVATRQDPAAPAVPPPLPADACGSGLTPRQVIAATPRRHSWAARSVSSSALPSARGFSGRDGRLAVLALAAAAGPVVGAAGEMGQVDGLAETLARVCKLRLPVQEQEGERQAEASDTSTTAAAAACSSLAPGSAGARLAALAAGAAASKADRWSLPVHLQAHSALALQQMDRVPLDAGESSWHACKGSCEMCPPPQKTCMG